MTSLTPQKKTMLASSNRSPYQPTTAAKSFKSARTSPERDTFSNVREIPLDPKAIYTISYLPGINEYNIDTGKTHDEARMKIVLLTCELERVNTYNYTLVRENEVLRVQANKSERERDLETKLAIVLAENEKLNQVIEDVYEAYMTQKGYGSGDNVEYERKLADLYEDLDDWKQKYNVLESKHNVVELNNTINDLQHQRDLLSEQLNRKDRDLEAIRARLSSLEEHSTTIDHNSNRSIAILAAENETLKRELDAMQLKFGNANSLQLKLADYDNKVRTILAENEKLNNLVITRVEEINHLRAQLDDARATVRITELSPRLNQNEQRKNAGVASPQNDNRIQELIKDNDNLHVENVNLKNRLNNAADVENHLHSVLEENQKLAMLLAEKEREVANLGSGVRVTQDNKSAMERLTVKLNELLVENEKLNRALEIKSANLHFVEDENSRLRDQSEQRKREIEDLYLRFNDANQSSFIVNELKEKIIIIGTENERLHSQLVSRAEENENLHRKIINLEAQRSSGDSSEERTRLLLAENQRLAIQVREQGSEIDGLRVRIHSNDVNAEQVESLRYKLTMISTENERLNRELDTLRTRARDDRTIEFSSQVTYLSQEKARLEALLEEKARDLSRLSGECVNLRGEIAHLKDNHLRVVENNVVELNRQNEHLKNAGVQHQNKIGELEGRLGQVFALETKVNYFNIEIEKLHKDATDREAHIQAISQVIAEKERELDDTKRRLFASENQRQTDIDQFNFRLQAEQDRKAQELRGNYESQIARVTNDRNTLEEKLILISVEIERLQGVTQSLSAELDDWKRRYQNLERERGGNLQEIEELRIQFENLKHMNYQVKELQQKFSAERIAYETQILQLNQAVTDLEHRVRYLTTENERLNGISVQRLNVIEELRSKIDDESHKLEVYELRNHLEMLKSNTYDVKQLSAQYSAERAADQSKIVELNGLVGTYKAEVQKLSEIIEMRKTDVANLAKQNEDLRRMCERMNQSRLSYSPEKAQSIEMLQMKIHDLEVSRDEYQRIADKNAIDLTRKNRELVDKIQELEVLKLKYEEAYANYQALNNQLFTRYSVNHN